MMQSSAEILIALLDDAELLSQRLRDEWGAIREELIQLLARIDDEGAEPSFRRALESLIERLLRGPARDITRGALARVEVAERQESRSGSGAGIEGPNTLTAAPAANAQRIVKVFFGTDRAQTAGEPFGVRFTGERGPLAYGVAEVSIPVHHQKGSMESPKWWRLQFNPNPERHVTVLGLHPLEKSDLVKQLGEAVGHNGDKDVLLFIHGYNVSFEEAARRAAQISHDLEFKGQTTLFSWASKGQPLLYIADEKTIEVSQEHLKAFLHLIMTEVGARGVHIIAHSMGNRALLSVLKELDSLRHPPGSAALRQVIFAAPDVDKQRFEQLAAAFRGRAERCTLYSSSNDLALRLSGLLALYPRAGKDLLFAEGVDTIDASEADTSLLGLGHSYFSSKPAILTDINALIAQGLSPERRSSLIAVEDVARRYWKYQVTPQTPV